MTVSLLAAAAVLSLVAASSYLVLAASTVLWEAPRARASLVWEAMTSRLAAHLDRDDRGDLRDLGLLGLVVEAVVGLRGVDGALLVGRVDRGDDQVGGGGDEFLLVDLAVGGAEGGDPGDVEPAKRGSLSTVDQPNAATGLMP